MRLWIVAGVLVGLGSIACVSRGRADFVVLSSSPNTERVPSAWKGAQSAPLVQPRYPLARGFGDKVPLAFAVRQIVPPSVKIHFGTGVDPTTPVDWRGGRPWNVVLWSAVHPLGLHLYLRAGTAWITN